MDGSPLFTPTLQADTGAPLPVTIAPGDGIGPEIMQATLAILAAAGAQLAPEEVTIGERSYLSGEPTGIGADAWESLARTKLLLKGPITTPQGGGYKSVNVTLRKTLGLFANIRPCRALHPVVPTRHPDLDVIIIRENEEDLYAGIEHQQTDEVVQCLKLISRPGTERIVRYGFEVAAAAGIDKVSCFTKDNIMKLTDGLFHRVFDEVSAQYPAIKTEHLIVDIGAARLADQPGRFKLVILPNLYGDILSDVAAEIAGSVGLAGSANIGSHGALFEAIHGSAPDIAGQDSANPSGLLCAAIMMLAQNGQAQVAARIEAAWLRTLEDGIHTLDIFAADRSKACVGTLGFAEAVIARLGQQPRQFDLRLSHPLPAVPPSPARQPKAEKTTDGVDLFLHWSGGTPADLAEAVQTIAQAAPGLNLAVITNRGVKVWPNGRDETFCTDHWRCRFMAAPGVTVSPALVPGLMQALAKAGLPAIKMEMLFRFDGTPGYTAAQGQ